MGNLPQAFHLVAHVTKHHLVVGQVIATELGQWGTLPHPFTPRPCGIGHMNHPRCAGSVYAARGAGRLFEVEHPFLYRKYHISVSLWHLGIFLEVGLSLLQKGLPAFLCLVEKVVEHGAVAG